MGPMPTPADAAAPLTGLGLGPAPEPSVVCCELCEAGLTNPTSRRWGLGRDCRRKLGLTSLRRPGRFTIEQEPLPAA